MPPALVIGLASGFAQFAFAACWIGGVIAGIMAMIASFIIAGELKRAQDAGEADNLPATPKELLGEALFTKNILPRVEAERLLFVWSSAIFAASAIGAFIVMKSLSP